MEWHEVLGNYATAGELVAAYRQRGVTDDDLAAAIEADWREFTHPAEIDETNLPHFEEVAHDLLRCYEEELQRVRGGEK